MLNDLKSFGLLPVEVCDGMGANDTRLLIPSFSTISVDYVWSVKWGPGGRNRSLRVRITGKHECTNALHAQTSKLIKIIPVNSD